MTKLLNKPLRPFAVFSLLLLAASIPIYYLVVDAIWLSELDEHNHIVKHHIKNKLSETEIDPQQLEQMLALWKVLEPGTTLELIPNKVETKDSLYLITRTTDFDGEQETDRFRGLVSYFTVNGQSYRFQTETNVEEADETLAAIAAVTVLFFVLLMLGFILLNRRISKQVWKPFYDTLERLSSFDLNRNPNITFEKSDIEEFEQLNSELERLILRSVSVYNQQKAFIENASHELQTPLAVLRTKLELLLQDKALSEQQAEVVSGVSVPLSRMSRINKNLLLLAKIENSQFADVERVSVAEVMDESLELLEDPIKQKRLSVERFSQDALSLECNRTLMEMLINNLLVNAITHSSEAATIIIETDRNGFTVSNSGKSALDANRVFERFARSSQDKQSSGLGLAIVKEICQRYGWVISYQFENGMHVFSVRV
ncbi:MAG: HAMP domain-containing histidine kinase [Flavobacteriales bacterium]|nr:HAMP domain-containing histidine kinase [Flavobacteriales bacterium]